MSEIILSNEQISVARYSENGVIRINGGPSSGKTLVAVKRAIFLAKDYKYAEKKDKILFLFYNKSLKNTVQKNYLYFLFQFYLLLLYNFHLNRIVFVQYKCYYLPFSLLWFGNIRNFQKQV